MMRAVRQPTLFALAVPLFLVAIACGPPDVQVPIDAGVVPPPTPAVTSVSPEPGPFNGSVKVTLTTDLPATIFVTTDGSDPRTDSAERHSGEGTVTVELSDTTTLTFYSRTAEGADEEVRTAVFTRAGPEKGTVTGVVVVDTIAVNHAVALYVNGELTDLGAVTQAQELPFKLEGLESGNHRLRAAADLNDNGSFVPLLDLYSDAFEFTLDLDDPFKAGLEGVRIHLGAPTPTTCAIRGTIEHPEPLAGETIRVSAVSPGALGGGGGGGSGDPSGLLSQLQNGYLIVADPMKTSYDYVITDLEPGNYVVTPMLTTLGNGGLSLNLMANPLAMVNCTAGDVTTANMAFGPIDLTGTVTLQPATMPTQGFVYGIVAAKTASLVGGVQAVLMPVLFSNAQGSTDYTGAYGGRGLRSNAMFGLRVFSNLESENPLFDALGWAIAVFGAQPPQSTVQAGTTDLKHDLTIPLP